MVLARRQRTTIRTWEYRKPSTSPRQRGELNPCCPAWAIWRHTNVVGRAIALAYVAGTTLVVVATGNHWVLDAVAGGVVVAVGILVSGRIEKARSQSARTAS